MKGRVENPLSRSISKPLLLFIDLLIIILVLFGYNLIIGSHTSSELEVLTLGLIAFLIIMSGHIASILLVPVAIIEIMLGMIASGFGAKPSEGLLLLSNIGANLLLFMAGSEIDIRLLKRRAYHSVILGSISFLISSIIAIIIYLKFELSVGALLILIAGFSATSVALTYSILKSSGLLSTRQGQLALTSAMIADLIGMLLLSIATASIDPIILFYIVILMGVLAIGPLLPRISGSPFEFEIRLVTMAIIVLGVASEIIGMHSVLTSFILGVVVSETVRNRKILQEKLESMATGFFTPFFFIVSGMKVDPTLMLNSIFMVLVVGLCVALLKMLPSYIYFKHIIGASPWRSTILSASQVPLLTVTIIASEAGIMLDLIDNSLYNTLMGVVIVTSIISTVISSRYSRRHGGKLF